MTIIDYTNAGTLQAHYEADYQAYLAAEAQEKADDAAYAAGLSQIMEMIKNKDSPDEILMFFMALMSDHGLKTQEDQVSVTSAAINVNSDLGAIASDMQNQLNDALSARIGTQPNQPTGGMNEDEAREMMADYKNLKADLQQQEGLQKNPNPALQSMLAALEDLNTQSGGLLDGNNPTKLSQFYNNLVANYSGGTNPAGPGGNPLSGSFSDLATVKQQLGSLSTPLNAETQYETQQISTVETFLTNLSKELAQLTKAFVTNQRAQ